MKSRIKVLVCAHDAGGANLLYFWAVRAADYVDIVQSVKGPAKSIFKETFRSQSSVENVDFVVTGTGWQSNLEFDAIKQAKENVIPVASFLDHWVNYEQRFIRDEQTVLPDKIWCADKQALAIARRTPLFENIPMRLVGNDYWKHVQRSLKFQEKNTLLVIHEPIRNPDLDMAQLIEMCLNVVQSYSFIQSVVFRVHPSGLDEFGEMLLKRLESQYSCRISSESLTADLSRSMAVVGYLSVVLAMAASMGYEVRSFSTRRLPDYLLYFGVK